MALRSKWISAIRASGLNFFTELVVRGALP